jgi:hypothetical protein
MEEAVKEPSEKKTYTKGEPVVTAERYKHVALLLCNLMSGTPTDAVRIEIDIEYADGGRVKMEAKA